LAKTRLNREERRSQILEAASNVFGRLGFESARMEDVAKEAGIAKGLLYKHFASKDALFRALVDRQGSSYARDLRTALAETEPSVEPSQALRAGLAFWLRMVKDDRASFNLTDPGVHDAYEGLRESLRGVIADAVRAAEPDLPEPFPRYIAALIQGAAENLGLVWRDDPAGVAEEDALNLLSTFCWGGLSQLAAQRD